MPHDLSLDIDGREPDPVLLAQLAQLASASTAPARPPWWRRVPRSGAAIVAGVLAISGAAYADRAASIPRQHVVHSSQLMPPKPHHEPSHEPELAAAVATSSQDPTETPERRHDGRHHEGQAKGHAKAHGKHHRHGKSPHIKAKHKPAKGPKKNGPAGKGKQ